METFAEARALVENEGYRGQRRLCLAGLEYDTIDRPIVNLVGAFNELPYCFTLQSCWGHFLRERQKDSRNLEPLPEEGGIDEVDYRIAYLALCVDNSGPGRKLLDALSRVPELDTENIQFGSPEWFWKKQVNSYALQVEPERFKLKDRVALDLEEALRIEQVRNRFFSRMEELVRERNS